jgi:hypothetical protein
MAGTRLRGSGLKGVASNVHYLRDLMNWDIYFELLLRNGPRTRQAS